MFTIGSLIKTKYPMFFVIRTFEEWEKCKFAGFLLTNQKTIDLKGGEICMMLQAHEAVLLLYHFKSNKIITALQDHCEIFNK